MKNLFAALLISTAATASFAATAEVPTITLITQGKYSVASQAPHCPIGAQCEISSMMALTLPLNGCLDSAVVAYKIEPQDSGKIKVLVTALNVSNKASRGARCIVAPMATKTIFLGMGLITKDSVEVEFVSSLAN